MAKSVVMVLGIILTLVGLLGFVNNPVLGIFAVNTLHNIVHLLTGILGIIFAAQGEAAAKGFAKVFGIIYALVAILGFVAPAAMLSLLMIMMPDNILHIILALIFLYVGFASSSPGRSPARA